MLSNSGEQVGRSDDGGDTVPGRAKCRQVLHSAAWFAFKLTVTWEAKKILSNLLGNSQYGGVKDRNRKPFDS